MANRRITLVDLVDERGQRGVVAGEDPGLRLLEQRVADALADQGAGAVVTCGQDGDIIIRLLAWDKRSTR